MAYFASRISEYSHFSGWGVIKALPSFSSYSSLRIKNFNSTFLDVNLLNEIIKKIRLSKYKERIYASMHMNRLSKYKASSHIAESITDCVSSVEALYMEEKKGRSDVIDKSILATSTNKTKALEDFLYLYYPGNISDLSILDEIRPYSIRSAFLHRGKLLEPVSGDISNFFDTLKESEKTSTYYIFYKIIYFTILNFILNGKHAKNCQVKAINNLSKRSNGS